LAQIYGEVSACGEPVEVYVAGAQTGEPPHTTSGAGVFFGPESDRNCALRTPGDQSPARATLVAALHALCALPPSSALRIRSHTDYLPRAVCHWAEHNARQHWEVVNGDVLLAIAWVTRARTGPV
ncbi:hypothetical protein LXA43DRAFT_856756, partial [Ganoderma leucocontextum]